MIMLYKQVIALRADIAMSPGKMIAQGAHVAVLASEIAMREKPEDYAAWKLEGHKKIVCKVESVDAIKELENKSRELGIPCATIADFGLTELEPGTITAIAIGPALATSINPVTKKLKLL